MNMSIRENIQQVRENIAAAALSAGRRPEDITLVGASKMNDAAACREAIAAGIDALGENRVQEMTQKLAEHAYDGAAPMSCSRISTGRPKSSASSNPFSLRSTSAGRRPRAALPSPRSAPPPKGPRASPTSCCAG